MTNIIKIFNRALPDLKGGEIKSFWLILQKTIAVGKVNTIIDNDEFIGLGAHLTKVRDVINSTLSLKDKGFIFRVVDEESEHNGYRYSVNLKKANLDKSDEL